jgi:hypothetical protein
MQIMCSLPNTTKSNFSEHPQCRKKKYKKTNFENTNIKMDEWAILEWTSVDSPKNTVGE